MPRFRTHYDNLKISRTASPEAIRVAYRRLSLKHHPDRNPGDPQATRSMTLINVAYRVLSNPEKRAAHDRWIASWEVAAEVTNEAAAEAERTPAGNYPPPPPPRRAKSTKPRKPKIDRSDIPEGLRQHARTAVFYVLSMMIFTPFLITVANWWNAPEPRPPSRTILHTALPDFLMKPSLASVPRQTTLPDLNGVYRLVNSENHGTGPNPRVYNKGKLVIRTLGEGAYVVMEAVTVRGAGTFGYGHVYRAYPDEEATGKVKLVGNHGSWFTGNADRLVKHGQGLNFRETLWWKREPVGYSEKYLDRGIGEAEAMYQVRVGRGLESDS